MSEGSSQLRSASRGRSRPHRGAPAGECRRGARCGRHSRPRPTGSALSSARARRRPIGTCGSPQDPQPRSQTRSRSRRRRPALTSGSGMPRSGGRWRRVAVQALPRASARPATLQAAGAGSGQVPPNQPGARGHGLRNGCPCRGSVRSRATALGRRDLVGYRAAPHKEVWTKMRCLECGSEAVTERPERTAQGYRRFRCRTCGKQFNERSGTLLNRSQYPSDVIALVVLWRLRYKLSLRDLPEMFLVRGIVFSHEAVREWEAKLTPALAEELRRRRRGQVGRSWYVDETYLKVQGRWCYLYRPIDRSGALVDVMFSEHRDMAAAKAFFRSAKAATSVTPDRVTTDGHDSYPRAIRTTLGKAVRHRTSAYLNNRLEQDHRGIKGRYRPMRGFKCPRSAARFCRAYDELRNSLRSRSRPHQHVSADRRRLLLLRRTVAVLGILEAA